MAVQHKANGIQQVFKQSSWHGAFCVIVTSCHDVNALARCGKRDERSESGRSNPGQASMSVYPCWFGRTG